MRSTAEHGEHGGTPQVPVLTWLKQEEPTFRASVGNMLRLSYKGRAVVQKLCFLFDGLHFLLSLKSQIKINAFYILINTAVKSHEVMLQFTVASQH